MWQKIEPDEEYIKVLRLDDVPEYAKARQYYGKDGNKWPLLSMAIYEKSSSFSSNGIILSTDYKENMESWWEQCHIPLDLIEDASNMLLHYKEKMK